MKTQNAYPKKAVLVIFTMILSAVWTSAPAQGYFAAPIVNPFGLDFMPSEHDLVFTTLVDMDKDGDLDMFASHRVFVSPCWIVSAFDFYENQGTSECPEFVKLPGETFGLPPLTAVVTFVDIDNDGDLDAFIGNHCFSSTLAFHRNNGTALAPQFSSTPSQMLDIASWNIGFAMLSFGDLDGDGDYDALVNGYRPAVFKYLENVGTPTNFSFGNPVNNPFGLNIPYFNSSEWAQFTDWDCDGDLDILNSHWQATTHNDWLLYIHENSGTPAAPDFQPPVATNQMILAITVGDMDGDGDADVFSDEYYLKNIGTTNCITLPTSGFSVTQNGLTVEFINEANGQATACRPMTYFWDFGDGTTSEEAAPTHTYAAGGIYNVCLTVEDIAGKSTVCEELDIVSAVSDREIGGYISVFPNPASGFIMVRIVTEMPMNNVSIEVLNNLGEVVKRADYNAHDLKAGVRVDIGDLASGIYMVKINGEAQSFEKQFVKIK
jgi:PKD repeat protein